jgi:glycosyltransferase involved in cell wall biosynthesis
MPRRIAVLVPCYNEAAAIAQVVADFRAALPAADIYVYDNNSSDDTCAVARAAGAIVRREEQQGKGHVVRRMFADIDAEVYVLVDGDATYHAPSAPGMVDALLDAQADMVVGCRVAEAQAAYRRGHRFGNAMLTRMVGRLFGNRFTDILSGYRVFSRRFVKSFPSGAQGFEIETELTVHALALGLPIVEIETPYGERPAGSVSKLHTYRDGWRILVTIASLFREERPLAFFAIAAGILAGAGVLLAIPLAVTYAATGLVPRLPTAVLATGLVILGALSMVCGLILDTVTRGRREMRRLAYLALPAPTRDDT